MKSVDLLVSLGKNICMCERSFFLKILESLVDGGASALLALADPPGVRQSLALDLDAHLVAFPALLAEEVVVRGLAEQVLGEVACLDAAALARRFHPAREVHCVAEEAVAGHLVANDARDDRAGRQPGPDEDLLPTVGAVRLDEVQGVEGEEGDALGGLGGGAAIGGTTDDHVGVPDLRQNEREERGVWIGAREK